MDPTSLSKACYITFVNFAVSGLTSIRQLSVPLLLLSFTPNVITVILSTINFLSLNYPASNRSRTLLLVLSLKLLSPVICNYLLQSDVDRVERFRLTLRCFDGVVIYFFNSDFKFFDDASKFSVTSFYVVFIFS